MRLVLLRRWFTEKSTIGELFIDPIEEGNRGFQCYTLEDRMRGPEEKVFGQTCFPCGEYSVELRFSPKLQADLPVIFNERIGDRYIIWSPKKTVKWEQCMFHSGNKPEDTEGCPLVGQTRKPDLIEFSRPALADLLQRVRYAIGKGEVISLGVALHPSAVLL